MITINTQQEFDSMVADGRFKVNDDVTFEFDLVTRADIDARDINARDINARNIDARNTNARNIDARDINARDINARNIDARNINARDITARGINYPAVWFAYNDIKCKSIEGRRNNSKHFVLDGEITINKRPYIITMDGKDVEVSEESFNSIKEQLTKGDK